jgi:hypothetical protein
MSIVIEVDIETIDEIVKAALAEAYYSNKESVENLEEAAKSRELEDFEKEDLANCKKLKKALKLSHNYFSLWEDRIK